MKTVKELQFDTLTTEQKIGLLLCANLNHGEKDVEDAFAAGDIKGRNTNIQRMREDFGDGMPKGMSSVAPNIEARRKRNSLVEKAVNA